MPHPKTPSSTISVSRMRALKNSRWTEGFPSHIEDELDGLSADASLPAGPHAPAKNEARLLRRICSQTGLTPEQVREHKTYRVQLSEAAKSRGRKTLVQRTARRLRKSLQSSMGLHPWSPELKTAFLGAWSRYDRLFRRNPVTSEKAFEESF